MIPGEIYFHEAHVPYWLPSVGLFQMHELTLQGVKICSVLARWLKVGQQQSEIRKKK